MVIGSEVGQFDYRIADFLLKSALNSSFFDLDVLVFDP
jgi:hypothetical protein